MTAGQWDYLMAYCHNQEYGVIRVRMEQILLEYVASDVENPEFETMLNWFGVGGTCKERVSRALDHLVKMEMLTSTRFKSYADTFGFLEVWQPLLIVTADRLRQDSGKKTSGSVAEMLREWLKWAFSEELQAFLKCVLYLMNSVKFSQSVSQVRHLQMAVISLTISFHERKLHLTETLDDT